MHAAAYRVLARKYRPTTFDDLIGQESMVRILRNAFAIGRVAHAFMLTGVRGVGKTTTARIIARALNCVGPTAPAARPPTRAASAPTASPSWPTATPTCIEMDAACRTGVDDVREIIEAIRFRPMQARTKVFIIDEVHMLSPQAFNALLKTLEEPPPHVKFVFATTELRKVPITVLSRCQRFDLRRVRVGRTGSAFRPHRAEGKRRRSSRRRWSRSRAPPTARCATGCRSWTRRSPRLSGTITAAQVADMLGLADREAVFDLMDAVMAGKPAAALAITDRGV